MPIRAAPLGIISLSADAGPDRSVEPGKPITLDAGNSIIPNQESTSYEWVTYESGIRKVVSREVTYTFTPEEGPRSYSFDLILRDGTNRSLNNVRIDVINKWGSFYIRYKESEYNVPSIKTGFTKELIELDFNYYLRDNTISGTAKANGPSLEPEYLLKIKLHSPKSTSIKGLFNAVIFGSLNGQFRSGIFPIDFDTLIVGDFGVQNDHELKHEIPINTPYQIDDSGKVSWGSWSGGIDKDGNNILLTKGNLILLASRDKKSTLKDLGDRSNRLGMAMGHYNSGSEKVSISAVGRFRTTNESLEAWIQRSTITNPKVSRPKVMRRSFKINPTNTSLIEFYSGDTLSEIGFQSYDKYLVIVNPSWQSSKNPGIIIIFPYSARYFFSTLTWQTQ